MNIWFTSDTHYWHENVIKFCDRPFKDLSHMHEVLIQRYNSRVKEQDVCIFVGDFSFGTAAQTKAILNQLNGTKILVQGNHDKKTTCNKFDVCFYTINMSIAGEPVSIKHYPLRWPRFSHFKERLLRWWKNTPNPRYLDRYPVDRGQFHIHGHTHSKERFKDNQIHVGVDAWDYYPVSIKDISQYICKYRDKSRR